MRHVICYACNKPGHIAKECRRIFWTPYQKEKTSSQLKIWKKEEVQPERCGIAEYTDITDLEEAESVEMALSCYMMVGTGSRGAYASNNALFALWLEVFGDDAY